MAYKKLTTTLVVITVCIIGVFAVAGFYIVRAAFTVTIDEEKRYSVEQVIDGDTFIAQIGWHEVTIRMLGIDTPETVDPRKDPQCYGLEASERTKSLLSGKHVRLALNPHREEIDKYGRYLAYVYTEDGSFLNESLLRDGYAREYTYGKAYQFQKQFRSIEREAREAGRGLWGRCTIFESNLQKKP